MTQVLHTAARAGIADAIGPHARSADEVAAALHLDLGATGRFLRMMVVLGLLVQEKPDAHEEAPSTYRLSASGDLLRADHPESQRDRILYIGAVNYPAAGAAMHSLQTGAPAFDHVFGMPFFDYLGQQPALGAIFNELMRSAVQARVAGVTGGYDFSLARSVVDIGGGNGELLASVLARTVDASGTLFDTGPVIAEARRRLAGSAIAKRIAFVEGDLFAGSYPAGADIYLLSNIIHDWNDAEAERILRNCAVAMRRDSHLLLVEEILPSRVADSPTTIANDYSMLLLTGGLERTEVAYRTLLARCGLTLNRTIPFSAGNDGTRIKGNWALLQCHAE